MSNFVPPTLGKSSTNINWLLFFICLFFGFAIGVIFEIYFPSNSYGALYFITLCFVFIGFRVAGKKNGSAGDDSKLEYSPDPYVIWSVEVTSSENADPKEPSA